MALSNKFGSLLLTTGNKSEMAVGYCTLYGDMCGGLAVIADVPKTMVYRLARWVNREREIIPTPPSPKRRAELVPTRPTRIPSPYETLDAILKRKWWKISQEQIIGRGFDLPGQRRDQQVTFSEYKRAGRAGIEGVAPAFRMPTHPDRARFRAPG
jgi:NAD+ synthetase